MGWGAWPSGPVWKGAGGALAPFARLSLLAEGLPLFRMADYRVDGVSGKVDRFYEYGQTAFYVEQTDPTKQVAVPVASALYAGQPAALFTGAEWYTSNRPASFFRRWHGAAPGGSTVCVFSPGSFGSTYYICGTFGGLGPGYGLNWQPATYVPLVRNTAGANIIIGSAPGVPARGIYRMQYQEGAPTPEWQVAGRITPAGTAVGSGDSTAAPDGGTDPEFTWSLGARSSLGAGAMIGELAMVQLGPYLTAAQIADQNALLTALYGALP